VQFDCGKLQRLDMLLRQLKAGGHRALIFTQMTKMLDVLEGFINMYNYTYLRLDGSTKIEDRQKLMERFNTDPRIFLFILSTRSGGVGVNLTGADTVIFYDTVCFTVLFTSCTCIGVSLISIRLSIVRTGIRPWTIKLRIVAIESVKLVKCIFID
jgi:hypothetical protein